MGSSLRSLALLCGLLAACLGQGNGPARRFHETVLDMNKSTRWGQLGDAVQWVEPSYRAQFAESHLGWGEAIQVADSEVVSVQMAPDQASAVALVSYEWYRTSAMTLHTTIVQQRWSQFGDNFLLVSERVVRGDERLLAEPEGDAKKPMTATAESLAPPG